MVVELQFNSELNNIRHIDKTKQQLHLVKNHNQNHNQHDDNEQHQSQENHQQQTNNDNNNLIINYEKQQLMNKDQLVAQIKSNLLYPAEVTFCNISDDEGESSNLSGSQTSKSYRRKRLISDTDTDSIVSSVNPHNNHNNHNNKKKPEIPDGGWGYVVVLASLVVSLIADGVSFSFGLLYSELLNYFNESKSKTAWVGSLFMAVPLMSGPIWSNLVDNYGCRRMTIIGGFVAGTGFILAAFSTSVEMLFFTFGIVAGLGLGIGYVTAVVSIAFWFDKKRTFATGIGASGTGIGTFLFAPLTQYLIDYYGWRGATIILAALIFNICVCGCLMRDPDWLIEENRLESRSQSVQTFSNSSVCLNEMKKLLEIGIRKEDVLDTLVTNFNTEANQQIYVTDDMDINKKYQSEVMLPTYNHNNNNNDNDTNEFKSIKYGSTRSLRENLNRKLVQISIDQQFLTPTSDETETDTDNKNKIINKNLASAETLNPSEKVSSYFDNQNDFESLTTTNCTSNEDIYRRLSLDEATIFKPHYDSYIFEYKNKGISLDAIDEVDYNKYNNNNNNNNKSNPPSPNPNIITIQVPPATEPSNRNNKVRNKPQRQFLQQQQNGNLKRNTSLRNPHYFRNMRIHRNSINYRGAILNTHRYRLRASSCPNIYRNSMTTIARESEEKWYDDFVDIIKSIFDFSLFLDIKFAMFNLSILFLFIWFIIPYFYITEHLLTHNYTEEDGAKLIAIIGIFNTIGMIFLGWAGDQPWLNITKTYACCLVVCGFSVSLMPLATHNYSLLIVLAVLFGITFASSFSFTPIILVRLVDLDDFTCAYGLVLLVQGIGNLVGPPLAGIIFDMTGRWDDSFYAAGFFISISGALAYITGMLEERDNKLNNSNDDDEENYSNNP